MASCDSYSLPRTHPSFPLSLLSPGGRSRWQWWREGGEPAIGTWGRRENEGSASGGSRQEQQEGGREMKGRGKRRPGIRFVQ